MLSLKERRQIHPSLTHDTKNNNIKKEIITLQLREPPAVIRKPLVARIQECIAIIEKYRGIDQRRPVTKWLDIVSSDMDNVA